MDQKITIAERIKQFRKDNNVSMPQLAKDTGISKENLYKWEKGHKPTNYEDVNTLLKFMETGKKVESITNKPPQKESVIPYYPKVNASAGLNFLTENGNNYSIPITIPNVDAQAFINVFGDSMYPKYCSGEIIGIKEVQKDFVMFGQAYVLQMADGEAYLKYIRKGKDDRHWILASENEKYEPKEFAISKISKVFIIKAVITKTTLL